MCDVGAFRQPVDDFFQWLLLLLDLLRFHKCVTLKWECLAWQAASENITKKSHSVIPFCYDLLQNEHQKKKLVSLSLFLNLLIRRIMFHRLIRRFQHICSWISFSIFYQWKIRNFAEGNTVAFFLSETVFIFKHFSRFHPMSYADP